MRSIIEFAVDNNTSGESRFRNGHFDAAIEAAPAKMTECDTDVIVDNFREPTESANERSVRALGDALQPAPRSGLGRLLINLRYRPVEQGWHANGQFSGRG